jgi:hypothetical protein
MEEGLQILLVLLQACTTPWRDLEMAVARINEYGSEAEEERDGGALMEFILQHSIGRTLKANAELLMDTRGQEKRAAERLDSMQADIDRIRSATCIDCESPQTLFDAALAIETVVEETRKQHQTEHPG